MAKLGPTRKTLRRGAKKGALRKESLNGASVHFSCPSCGNQMTLHALVAEGGTGNAIPIPPPPPPPPRSI